MQSRRVISLVAGALLAGGVVGLRAQETTAAPQAADTTVQGYVPSDATPAAAPVAAEAAAAPAPTGRAAIGAQLGFIDVLPARAADRINADMELIRGLDREADADLAHAQSELARTKALIAEKKQEISSIDGKRKLADKSKQEAEKIAYEAEKKDAERHKAFLERRASLHVADIDRAKAAKKLAEKAMLALELESQLASRRRERAAVAGSDPAATRRHDAVILELEGRTLEAERQKAEAEKQVADKDVDIARRRLELHKAQVAAAGR